MAECIAAQLGMEVYRKDMCLFSYSFYAAPKKGASRLEAQTSCTGSEQGSRINKINTSIGTLERVQRTTKMKELDHLSCEENIKYLSKI